MTAAAFYNAFAPILAPIVLIHADQNAPRPAKPYVTMSVARVSHPPFPTEGPLNAEGKVVMTEQLRFQMELMAFGPDAHGILSQVASKVRYPSQVQRIHELGLSIATVGEPIGLTAYRGAQAEEQASLEIAGYATTSGQDVLGLIEQVQGSGSLVNHGGTIDADFAVTSPTTG